MEYMVGRLEQWEVLFPKTYLGVGAVSLDKGGLGNALVKGLLGLPRKGAVGSLATVEEGNVVALCTGWGMGGR